MTPRTIRNWESGATRIPYAAYKLLRVLGGGKFLGDDWPGYFVRDDKLITPEGHTFAASDLAWWSLLVRQAREFQRIARERHTDAAERHGARATGHSAAPVARLDDLGVDSEPSTPRAHRRAAGEDPSAHSFEDLSTRTGEPSASRAPDGQRPSKSLKSKRIPPESLSLTLPNRPENLARKSQVKAVLP